MALRRNRGTPVGIGRAEHFLATARNWRSSATLLSQFAGMVEGVGGD